MNPLDGMTVEELQQVVTDAQTLIEQKIHEQQQGEQDARARLTESINTLTALIGPDEPTAPGLDSLTEVRLFSEQEMAEYSGLAHTLEFLALEIVARAVRDIAYVVGK